MVSQLCVRWRGTFQQVLSSQEFCSSMYFCRRDVPTVCVYFEALSGSYKSECLGLMVDLGTSVLIGFADVTTS
jgi:hypothetical protein